LDLAEKLEVLGAAARYDAACTSSGTSRSGAAGQVGSAVASGICHTWAADGRCVSLLKVLHTNACIYNCEYCQNRCDNDIKRASFTSEELCELTMSFYNRNYIEGLFLSSGVVKSPDYTMELMTRTLAMLRGPYRFGGYIHVKAIPGASAALVEKAGLLADRVSVNIELPSSGSLATLAPQKAPADIFTPMTYIRDARRMYLEDGRRLAHTPRFAPAGQSTQLIVGASPDSDMNIVNLSQGLYRKYKLKRVFYSAYIAVGSHPLLPEPGTPPPLLREHRLYQSDFLLRFYSFDAGEIVNEAHPMLEPDVDPKCAWALRHPEFFPVEANRADYETLLRVPGVGQVSAKRIIAARRIGPLRAENLRPLGVVMKRARFFLTAGGKYEGEGRHDHPQIRQYLADNLHMEQLSLFGTPGQMKLPGRR
jgi:putative DNA modification/repair radical SAM protein